MIVVLVEGPGDKGALPILTRRAGITVPIRPIDMRGKSNIVRRNRGFEDTVRRQHALGRRSFVVLVDADVTSAPYRSITEETADMRRRARSLAQELEVNVRVHWAVLEAESWLIGGIPPGSRYCGLDRVGRVPPNTETAPADPKQWLENHLGTREYKPRTQACLAASVDLAEARARNQSLREFLAIVE